MEIGFKLKESRSNKMIKLWCEKEYVAKKDERYYKELKWKHGRRGEKNTNNLHFIKIKATFHTYNKHEILRDQLKRWERAKVWEVLMSFYL